MNVRVKYNPNTGKCDLHGTHGTFNKPTPEGGLSRDDVLRLIATASDALVEMGRAQPEEVGR